VFGGTIIEVGSVEPSLFCAARLHWGLVGCTWVGFAVRMIDPVMFSQLNYPTELPIYMREHLLAVRPGVRASADHPAGCVQDACGLSPEILQRWQLLVLQAASTKGGWTRKQNQNKCRGKRKV